MLVKSRASSACFTKIAILQYSRLLRDLSNTFSLLTKIEVFTENNKRKIGSDIKRQFFCLNFFSRQTYVQSFCVKDSYVEGSVESVNIKIYGTFVRIDAGNSTRKRISSVGGTMNARFRDQFRTAIEVREIGNPSGNDVS